MASVVSPIMQPAAKRPRLSLKTMRSQKTEPDKVKQVADEQSEILTSVKAETNPTPCKENTSEPLQETPQKTQCTPQLNSKARRITFTTLSSSPAKPKVEDDEEKNIPFSPAKQNDVPPCVTGLENLCNTCYMNSILQVLRFSPGFEEAITTISRQICGVQKQFFSKSSGDAGGDQLPAPFVVVQRLARLFSQMNRVEEKLKDTDQHITAKPIRLLETISEINPMFEGGLQHDAHELLCCIQNAIQDSQKELSKYTLETKSTKQTTPASDNKQRSLLSFFSAVKPEPPCDSGVDTEASSISSCASSLTNDGNEESTSATVKVSPKALSPKSKIYNVKDVADQIFGGFKKLVGIQNGISSGETTPTKACEKKMNGDERSPCKVLNSSSLSRTPSPRKRLSVVDVIEELDGKRRVENDNFKAMNGSKENCSNGIVSDAELIRKRDVNGNVKHENGSPLVNSALKNQPSIMSAFASVGKLKRFGTTSTVIRCSESKIKNGIKEEEKLEDDVQSKSSQVRKSLRMPKVKEMKDYLYEEESPAKLKLLAPLVETPEVLPKLCKMSDLENVSHTTNHYNHRYGDTPNSDPKLDRSSEPRVVLTTDKSIDCLVNPIKENKLKQMALKNAKKAIICLEKCDSPSFRIPWLQLNYHGTPTKRNCSNAIKVKENPDSIEQLFEGVMVLRTRCSECEHFTERLEEYQDISVPVRQDKTNITDEECSEDNPHSWLLKGLSHIEKLRDDNKYYCDRCTRYVEAERAVLYKTLPKILTIHMKRFAAVSGVMGTFGLTKINDFVSVPMNLSCFSSKCDQPCSKASHQYELYGVVMHAGLSISAGHYTAFVKIPPRTEPVKEVKKTPESAIRKSIRQRDASPTGVEKQEVNGDVDDDDGFKEARPLLSTLTGQWLECDDEDIKVMTEDQFISQALSHKSVSGTPYLLFYKSVES